jgi:hypothetical protein
MNEENKACDICESTISVVPIIDPWGGFHGHGYTCEACEEEKQGKIDF